MKYTIRDLHERAEHEDLGQGTEVYNIDNHCIALIPVWSYGGGRNEHLVSVKVDGKVITTRCKRELGLRKALATISK